MKLFQLILCVWATFIFPAHAQTQKLKNDKLIVKAGSENTIEIVDGDTLWVGNHEIRLYGIDAPEAAQGCVIEGQPKSYCHKSASAFLEQFAKHPDFECEFWIKKDKPWIRYGRYVSECRANGMDISKELVRNGWAYADPTYGESYVQDEEYAKANKLGMHATGHKTPWEWRKEKRGDSCSCK